jgi:hypothetical protein
MKIDAQVEIGSAHLSESERGRGGSMTSEKDGEFEFATPESRS